MTLVPIPNTPGRFREIRCVWLPEGATPERGRARHATPAEAEKDERDWRRHLAEERARLRAQSTTRIRRSRRLRRQMRVAGISYAKMLTEAPSSRRSVAWVVEFTLVLTEAREITAYDTVELPARSRHRPRESWRLRKRRRRRERRRERRFYA